MLIKKPGDIPSSEITPRRAYLNRRKFLAGAAAAAGAALVGGRELLKLGSGDQVLASTKLPNVVKSQYSTDERPNPYEHVTTYNNFYEFGTDKGDPVRNAGALVTQPWT